MLSRSVLLSEIVIVRDVRAITAVGLLIGRTVVRVGLVGDRRVAVVGS